jgi:hypothetical protein
MLRRKTWVLCAVSLTVLASLSSFWMITQARSFADPQGVNLGTTAGKEGTLMHNYYLVASAITAENKAKTFANLSADDRTRVFKLHLALQLSTRPHLTEEQRRAIVDEIVMAGSDLHLPFYRNENEERFDTLAGDSASVRMLKTYEHVTEPIYASSRRAAFRDLTPQAKSETFRTHLALQMAMRPLSRKQVGFIATVLPKFSGHIYETRTKDDKEYKRIRDWLTSLSQQLRSYFPEQEAADIFASLGGLRAKPKRIESVFLRGPNGETLPLDSPDVDPLFLDEGPVCSCSVDSDYCSWWTPKTHCREEAGINCRATSSGCGTALQYRCDGQCYVNLID